MVHIVVQPNAGFVVTLVASIYLTGLLLTGLAEYRASKISRRMIEGMSGKEPR